MNNVCADCGFEQNSPSPCGKCQSFRVVTQDFAELILGKEWRKAFTDEPIDPSTIPAGTTIIS